MIDLTCERPVTRLVLSRAEARNALTVRDWERLAETVEAVAASEARVLVLSGGRGRVLRGRRSRRVRALPDRAGGTAPLYSIAMLKRGVLLARQGVSVDAEQDGR